MDAPGKSESCPGAALIHHRVVKPFMLQRRCRCCFGLSTAGGSHGCAKVGHI